MKNNMIIEPADLMIHDWVYMNHNVFIEDEYESAKPIEYYQIQDGDDINLAI